MARVVLVFEYPPIPIRQFDWYAYYEGEADEHMDIGYGATSFEARCELLDNYPRPFNLGDFLLDLSPFIIVPKEGSYYDRVSPLEWLKFIFRKPDLSSKVFPDKCWAGLEIPYTQRALGFDFIINRKKLGDPWRWSNRLPEYF